MQFDRENLGHRKLLALAIQDYLNQPGATLYGDGKMSLATDLKKVGVAISRPVLTRLANINVPKSDYPSHDMASRCAEGLRKLGFWPAGDDIERSLRRLPAFYGGFHADAAKIMKELLGGVAGPKEYVSYQYSNRHPENILIGRLTLEPMTPWHYAPVTNVIKKTGSTARQIAYEGIAWTTKSFNIYMQMRIAGYQTFNALVLDDIVRGDDRSILAINGTGLGGARLHTRHLTSICLYNGPYPEDDSHITPDEFGRMPDIVREFMSMSLAQGYKNRPAPRQP